MSTSTRMQMTAPAMLSHVGGGGGRMFFSPNRPGVESGMVTRCVMPRDFRRGRLEDEDPNLRRLGCRQTGERCGPGNRGEVYECPAMAMIGTAPGLAGRQHRYDPYWHWNVERRHFRDHGPAMAPRPFLRVGLGDVITSRKVLGTAAVLALIYCVFDGLARD